ncbi:peptidase [Dolosigranulum pigrum]|jgi:hypothetical protein|uniref:peptidase n=1 Tax=Dolosigranulum pigrum TaxID=29394 RepID=UPI000DC28AAF|nr:peptidase [Dolosigranulum pigrum]QTJ38018.1 peptidase [Dolosigranulum pigrum]RAN59590.1 peptidase [Dolosigranulum pigrum]
MAMLDSWRRVEKKREKFADIFGYLLVYPIYPKAAIIGPQEESDQFEEKLDKCIADKYDYFADEYGYNSEEKRQRVEANKYVFYD